MSRKCNKSLAFEEYFYFYHDPICEDLNTKQLKEVLFMHGLEKLSYHTKEDIMAAVRSLCLISPTRSTFNICSAQLIPCGAVSAPSIQEVKQDIRDLEWQECAVGSIVTVGPAALGVAGCGTSDDSSLISSLIVPLRPEKERSGVLRKSLRRNKKKATKVIHVPTRYLKDIDEHSWANNGSRTLKDCLFNRTYYKCKGPGCLVMKYVDCDPSDPSMRIVTYKGEHGH